MKHAVMACFFKDQKLFCISRKNQPDKIGLIGGKVDAGETLEIALQREVFEESGLTIKVGTSLHEEMVGPYLVTTFMVDYPADQIPTPEAGSSLSWLSPEDFVNNSEFPEYNLNVLKKLGLR